MADNEKMIRVNEKTHSMLVKFCGKIKKIGEVANEAIQQYIKKKGE